MVRILALALFVLLQLSWVYPREVSYYGDEIPSSARRSESPSEIKRQRNPNDIVAFEIKHEFGETLKIGPDMIFHDEGDVHVNQGRLIVTRELDINPMIVAQDVIDERIESHRAICEDMSEGYDNYHQHRFHLLTVGDSNTTMIRYYHQAQGECNSRNMDLPEVRHEVDRMELIRIMRKHRVASTHAGVRRIGQTDSLTFTSGNGVDLGASLVSPGRLRLTPLCEDLISKNKSRPWVKFSQNAVFSYHLDQTSSTPLDLMRREPTDGGLCTKSYNLHEKKGKI